MKKFLFACCLFFALPALAAPPPIGTKAPDFTGTDTNGGTQTLSAYRGKTVVLEWSNPDCPYVHKHYDSHNMQKLQDEEMGQGIVWLTIVSSAQGREGYMTPAQANAYKQKEASHSVRILDPQGDIGLAYDATATPDMYIIDKTGTLVYEGAIDDMPTPALATIGTAHNYVRAALADLAAGRPVQKSVTQPYGCSVKYAE